MTATTLTLDMTHVRHAVAQVSATLPREPASLDSPYAWVNVSAVRPQDATLFVMLAGLKDLAVFAAALTASLTVEAAGADSDLTPATCADRAAADAQAIMAAAENSWEDRMADKGGMEAGRVLIVYFPGVTITGATPEETP